MKNRQLLPYFLTFTIVLIMVGTSQLLNNPEIIFPEITALAIGTLLAPKQVWKISSLKLVLLIMIYAVIGVLMVKYLHVSLFIKVVIGFTLCQMGLILSKTTFAPLISACILPLLLNTDTWIYPLSATIMSIIIIVIQKQLQKKHYIHDYHYQPVTFDYRHELILFCKRLFVVGALGMLALRLDIRLLIAPPLIVAFYELSGNHQKLRSQAPRLYFLTISMAFISAYLRYFLNIQCHFSVIIPAVIATALLLFFIYYFQIFFPPVGAITILPMIIQPHLLLVYPILIAAGFALLIVFAFLISYQKSSN